MRTRLALLIFGLWFAWAALPAQAWQFELLEELERGDKLTVHEWGTFLAMAGSDGVTLEGMYHEEHALPAFVHARSREQLRLPSVLLKGETPVIYFYTDRRRHVRVDVGFPKGIWTQWYPQAQVVAPTFSQVGRPLRPSQGRIVWGVELTPPTPELAGLPPKTSADALWNYARDVDAAYVTIPGAPDRRKAETERFLFYRGLGEATLPLSFSAADGGTLGVDRASRHGVAHLFILRVEDGRGVYAYREGLKPGDRLSGVIPSLAEARPLEEFSARLGDDLARRLEASGLYQKEARAMVNTWRTSYFKTEGIRVLFILPREWTDAFIPLKIVPTPEKMVRVMVGRIELLTPDRERLAEAAIGRLASPDAAVREKAFGFLRDQGRYVEPVVRRVLRTSADQQVRTLCRRLLGSSFVTELRAAVNTPRDGSYLWDDPEHVRAQLACVLHEIGLDGEAKAEGTRVLKTLRERTEPPFDKDEMRHYLRAYARAIEATGDARGAAEGYGRFIRFGSQVAANQDCRGCHREAGPPDMSWFRGWWAGERYAANLDRTGEAEREVRELESSLAKDPSDVTARMKLAYLYEARGMNGRAEAIWAAFGRKKLGPTTQGPATADAARGGEAGKPKGGPSS